MRILLLILFSLTTFMIHATKVIEIQVDAAYWRMDGFYTVGVIHRQTGKVTMAVNELWMKQRVIQCEKSFKRSSNEASCAVGNFTPHKFHADPFGPDFNAFVLLENHWTELVYELVESARVTPKNIESTKLTLMVKYKCIFENETSSSHDKIWNYKNIEKIGQSLELRCCDI
jgi:hypothetical protein